MGNFVRMKYVMENDVVMKVKNCIMRCFGHRKRINVRSLTKRLHSIEIKGSGKKGNTKSKMKNKYSRGSMSLKGL